MNTYTVLVQQEFHGVRAPSPEEAARQVEDLIQTGGHSPQIKIFVANYSVTKTNHNCQTCQYGGEYPRVCDIHEVCTFKRKVGSNDDE